MLTEEQQLGLNVWIILPLNSFASVLIFFSLFLDCSFVFEHRPIPTTQHAEPS